jgi:hypothetical protein
VIIGINALLATSVWTDSVLYHDYLRMMSGWTCR